MATATEFVTLEEALVDYEQATGVCIELDELLEAAKAVLSVLISTTRRQGQRVRNGAAAGRLPGGIGPAGANSI